MTVNLDDIYTILGLLSLCGGALLLAFKGGRVLQRWIDEHEK